MVPVFSFNHQIDSLTRNVALPGNSGLLAMFLPIQRANSYDFFFCQFSVTNFFSVWLTSCFYHISRIVSGRTPIQMLLCIKTGWGVTSMAGKRLSWWWWAFSLLQYPSMQGYMLLAQNSITDRGVPMLIQGTLPEMAPSRRRRKISLSLNLVFNVFSEMRFMPAWGRTVLSSTCFYTRGNSEKFLVTTFTDSQHTSSLRQPTAIFRAILSFEMSPRKKRLLAVCARMKNFWHEAPPGCVLGVRGARQLCQETEVSSWVITPALAAWSV